jgi:hypothetical protein
MRRLLAALLVAAPLAAHAQELDRLPQFPKIGPPDPLPEATCDTAQASSGAWLLGRWVAPRTRLDVSGQAPGMAWTMDRGGGGDEFGWKSDARAEGGVADLSGCSVRLVSGDFVFHAVLTEEGRLYGFATSKAGTDVRMVFRRER